MPAMNLVHHRYGFVAVECARQREQGVEMGVCRRRPSVLPGREGSNLRSRLELRDDSEIDNVLLKPFMFSSLRLLISGV